MSVRRKQSSLRLSLPTCQKNLIWLNILIRCSFRIRIRTPWSEKDLERKVESSMPGNCLALKTWKTLDVIDCKKQTSALQISFTLRCSTFELQRGRIVNEILLRYVQKDPRRRKIRHLKSLSGGLSRTYLNCRYP